MQTENTIGYDSCHGQIVKRVREMLPHVGISILSQAFIVETIHLRNLPTLMVSSKDCNSISVPNLQSYQKSDSF